MPEKATTRQDASASMNNDNLYLSRGTWPKQEGTLDSVDQYEI